MKSKSLGTPVAIIASILLCSREAFAQPAHFDTDHWVVTIPTGVEVFDDGRAEPQANPFVMNITTTDVSVVKYGDIPTVLPSSVPLFTTDMQGVRVRGIPQRANLDLQMYVQPDGPSAVYLDGAGNYALYVGTFTSASFEVAPGQAPVTGDFGRVLVDCTDRPLPYGDIRVVYGAFPQTPLATRGNWQPTYQFDNTMPAGQTGTLIQAAADRTASRFGLIMGNNIGPMRVDVVFVATGNPAIGPGTQAYAAIRSFSQVKLDLERYCQELWMRA